MKLDLPAPDGPSTAIIGARTSRFAIAPPRADPALRPLRAAPDDELVREQRLDRTKRLDRRGDVLGQRGRRTRTIALVEASRERGERVGAGDRRGQPGHATPDDGID